MDLITEITCWSIIKCFDLYEFMVRFAIRIIFPMVKWYVDRELGILGHNAEGKGPLGIRVHDEKEFYLRVFVRRHTGLFEAHMDKVCTINDVKAMVISGLQSTKTLAFMHPLSTILDRFNLQSRSKVWQVGAEHYDLGNDLFETILCKNLLYTCAYWRNSSDLESAQIAKMDLVARKLKLKPGMKVLDIGFGYGALDYHLAKHYGVSVVAISISKGQIQHATKLCDGLPVEFRICDYRDLNEKFDRIAVIGMIEHVGHKNYREFFKVCNRCLTDDGLMLLHTIVNNDRNILGFDYWCHKYIFPNGCIPYYLQVCKAIEDVFLIEDWQNFGYDYYKTLAAWEVKFEENWDKLAPKYGERFHRMWHIYLNCAQAFFQTRSYQLWQIVLSKRGVERGYESVR
ncbi:cyclopropane-fatty-acyl-phospholipid synthase [Folsomia candida]|uniref:Cyclopropane-fatty-acyl-phospholipid synthase n=1 Tax=Folsomia candida TaxID=158441 RepID=A0A226CYB0_FOLCA|nr:cyclopropane-fatty-acyl-phospholipid synthase [Folsomia candida]OXA37401.1 Cyclopropane-fatty-acyl-phospholipid synthase [Folsomia candida]